MRNTPRPSAGISAPSRPRGFGGDHSVCSSGYLNGRTFCAHGSLRKTPINSQYLCPGVTNVPEFRRPAPVPGRGGRGHHERGRRDAGPDRFRRQPRPVAAGGRPGRDPADPHHAAHGTDRGRRAVPAEGARHRRVAGRGRGMHAHGAPAARRPAARRRLGAGHAALRGAACGRVPPRLSRDHAGADQQRPHRRPDGTPQRRGAARRPADRLHTARPPAAPRAALAAGQPHYIARRGEPRTWTNCCNTSCWASRSRKA